jgi:hypothetical protein
MGPEGSETKNAREGQQQITALIFTMYYWRDESKEDEMGEGCSTHEKNEKCIRNFKLESQMENII